MSNEMPHELSENQPPAWKGTPEVPPIEPTPEPAPQPQTAERLDFGSLLGRVWELVRADWRRHFLNAFVIAAGFSALAIILVSVGVQNLSDEAWGVLNGETLPISEEPTAAELEALFQVLLEVFSLLGWLLPALLIAQLVISGFSTRLAMNHRFYNRGIQRIPWVKLVTAHFTTFLILTLMFAPMIAAFVTNQISLGLLLLLVTIVFAVWFGIGIVLLTPLVMAEERGGLEAVRHTLAYAKGRRLVIVGISLLVGILGSLLASTITQFVSLLPGTGDALWYFVVTNFIPLALSLPLSAIASTVLYLNYTTRD